MAVNDSVSELASFEVGDQLFPLTATLAAGKEACEKASSVQLSRRDSRTLETAQKRVPKRVGVVKAELIYYNIYFTCVFGGKEYKNKGTGQMTRGRAIAIASSIDSPTTSYPIFDDSNDTNLCIYIGLAFTTSSYSITDHFVQAYTHS